MKRKEDILINQLIEEEIKKEFCEDREKLRKHSKESIEGSRRKSKRI